MHYMGIDNKRKESTKPRQIKKLSIIIPCYNEETTIEQVIEFVHEVDLGPIEKEIVVVDDKSSDNSLEILNSIAPKFDLTIIAHEENQGKTAALITGEKHTTGDAVIVQDADLEYDPQDYIRLIRPLVLGQIDVVYGSRFLPGPPKRTSYGLHTIANKGMTWLSNLLNRSRLSDIHCCYIMMTKEVADEIYPKITSSGFGFNAEVASRIFKVPNVRVCEVGVSYFGRTKAEGKKIGLKDGLQAIRDIFYYGLFAK